MFKRNCNLVSSFPEAPINLKNAEQYQKSPIDEFLLSETVDNDGNIALRHVNDVYLLFNQQRLANLGVDTINSWLESLTPKSDALAELRSKCTDQQLLSLVKSKYIQSASELEAWSTYLNTHYESEIAAIAAVSADNAVDDDYNEGVVSSSSVSSDSKTE